MGTSCGEDDGAVPRSSGGVIIMRVLHVGKFYPPDRGGMETHLQLLCGELSRFIRVRVLVANKNWRTLESDNDGFSVTRLSSLFQFSAASACPSMVSRIRETEADVIHLHWPNPTAVMAYLASRHPAKLVITYHSDVIRQKLLEFAFRPILHQAMNRAAAIIASSPNYIESSPILRAFRQRCRVIPFGIPVESYTNIEPRDFEKIRTQHGPRLILAVGRLVYYKGFEHLIAAMAHINGKLLIVGSGPLREKLDAQVRNLGLEERVTILGNVDNVTPYYHAAEVFVLPSIARSEAFGIVQLEAMACGKPVVNTQLDSGVPFVSPDHLTGLTVPPGDPLAIAAAINNLLNNADLRAACSRAAKRRVEEHFRADLMAHRTLELYDEVLGRTRPTQAVLTQGTRAIAVGS